MKPTNDPSITNLFLSIYWRHWSFRSDDINHSKARIVTSLDSYERLTFTLRSLHFHLWIDNNLSKTVTYQISAMIAVCIRCDISPQDPIVVCKSKHTSPFSKVSKLPVNIHGQNDKGMTEMIRGWMRWQIWAGFPYI